MHHGRDTASRSREYSLWTSYKDVGTAGRKPIRFLQTPGAPTTRSSTVPSGLETHIDPGLPLRPPGAPMRAAPPLPPQAPRARLDPLDANTYAPYPSQPKPYVPPPIDKSFPLVPQQQSLQNAGLSPWGPPPVENVLPQLRPGFEPPPFDAGVASITDPNDPGYRPPLGPFDPSDPERRVLTGGDGGDTP